MLEPSSLVTLAVEFRHRLVWVHYSYSLDLEVFENAYPPIKCTSRAALEPALSEDIHPYSSSRETSLDLTTSEYLPSFDIWSRSRRRRSRRLDGTHHRDPSPLLKILP